MKNLHYLILLASLVFPFHSGGAQAGLEKAQGEYVLPVPPEPPKELRNEWPPELEKEFQARIQTNLQTCAAK